MSGHEHPQVDEWARLLDGEVTANRAAQMEAHASRCSDCEREVAQLASLIGELERPVVEVDQTDVSAIMRRLDQDVAPLRPSSRVWWYSAAAMASAAGILLMVSLAERGDTTTDPGTFTPRGGSDNGDNDLARKVGFSFFAGDSADIELSSTDSISVTTPITATYRNVSARATYALIFAIDSAGDVHWLYPAFTDPNTDPASVRLSPDERAGQFGETVALDAPATGVMSLVSIVTSDPVSVSSVEGLDDRTVDGLRRSFPGAAVSAIEIEVLP